MFIVLKHSHRSKLEIDGRGFVTNVVYSTILVLFHEIAEVHRRSEFCVLRSYNVEVAQCRKLNFKLFHYLINLSPANGFV